MLPPWREGALARAARRRLSPPRPDRWPSPSVRWGRGYWRTSPWQARPVVLSSHVGPEVARTPDPAWTSAEARLSAESRSTKRNNHGPEDPLEERALVLGSSPSAGSSLGGEPPRWGNAFHLTVAAAATRRRSRWVAFSRPGRRRATGSREGSGGRPACAGRPRLRARRPGPHLAP